MYSDIRTPVSNSKPLSDTVQPLNPGIDPKRMGPQKADAPKFDEMLKGFLTDVNHMQNYADESIQKMVAGEIKDVHQVMLAVGEAKVAFNLMLEIRNKTMDAYNELIKMRG
ncbi:MAG: flagellar hook-basal body complex protein FliE [Fibromonadaceae bacterium]|jgi:flagellar hook-basal body complex protein FliE|nr:flagellar hook-basal body complex protein FliE [Fibromonadales bacterium]MDR2581866.1 flagellar hook-basal body complex protein FliE [Fibromonadaceae bacterium]